MQGNTPRVGPGQVIDGDGSSRKRSQTVSAEKTWEDNGTLSGPRPRVEPPSLLVDPTALPRVRTKGYDGRRLAFPVWTRSFAEATSNRSLGPVSQLDRPGTTQRENGTRSPGPVKSVL